MSHQPATDNLQPATAFQCHHAKADGLHCNSPALIDSAFCHLHQRLHRTRRTTIDADPGLSTNVLQPLHSARSIQQALAMVLTGVASGRIHPKTASKMLYGLQMASREAR